MRISRLACMLAGAVACGGGGESNGPTPPSGTPVVTSLELTPTASLSKGDTLRLSVTVKDQHGAVMTGKTPTWTTGSAAIATVSAAGLVTAIAGGQTTITAHVEGKQATCLVTVTAPVELDAARLASASIGPSGGTVATTGSDGTTYKLEIPPGALDQLRTISIAPVTAVRTLTGVAVEAAAQFQPTGLTLRVPARLRIHKTVQVASGNRLAAVMTNDDGADTELTSAGQSNGDVVIRVSHFSTGAALQGTPNNIAQLPAQSPTVPTTLDTYEAGVAAIVAQAAAGHSDAAHLDPIFHQWYLEYVEPAMIKAIAAEFTIDLFDAAATFEGWFDQSLSWPITTPPADLDQARRRLKQAIGVHLGLLVDRGVSAPSVGLLQDAIVFYKMAKEYGLEREFPGELSLNAIERDLGFKVVVTDSTFPDPAPGGQPAELTLRAGVQFDPLNPALVNTQFRFKMSVDGGSPSSNQGNSDVDGRYRTSVTPTGGTTLALLILYCVHPLVLDPTGEFTEDAFCAAPFIIRPFGRVLTAQVSIQSDAGLAQIADVSKIVGSLSISGANVLSSDLRELAQLTEVEGNLFISGLPNLKSLAGLSHLTKVTGSLVVQGNPQLVDIGLRSLTSLGGVLVGFNQSLAAIDGLTGVHLLNSLTIQESPALASLNGFSGLTAVESLTLQTLPSLASLAPLRGVAITKLLQVGKLDALTSLADLTLAPSMTTVLVHDNAALTDLAALANVTSVVTLWVVRNPVLPNLNGLAQLKTLGSGTNQGNLGGASLTSLAGLASLEQGFLKIDLDGSPVLGSISLPSFTNGGVTVVANSCPTARHVSVSLPEFATGRSLGVSIPATGGCTASVSAPKLTNATDGLQLSGGISSYSFASSFTGKSFVIGGTNLTTITVPMLDVVDLTIVSNSALTSLQGGGGKVTGRLAITFNPNLSTQAAKDWAATFSPIGQLLITNNKVP